MIPKSHALDRDIRESRKRLEKNFNLLSTKKTSKGFIKVFARFCQEISMNKSFEPYKKKILDEELEYRQKPEIASILQKAYTPTGQQALDQTMLIRQERISEYFSLWLILRFNELYNSALHEQVRAELITKNDLRDLADFNAGIYVLSNFPDGHIDDNFSDFYLPHAHRVTCGIIRFFDKKE